MYESVTYNYLCVLFVVFFVFFFIAYINDVEIIAYIAYIWRGKITRVVVQMILIHYSSQYIFPSQTLNLS